MRPVRAVRDALSAEYGIAGVVGDSLPAEYVIAGAAGDSLPAAFSAANRNANGSAELDLDECLSTLADRSKVLGSAGSRQAWHEGSLHTRMAALREAVSLPQDAAGCGALERSSMRDSPCSPLTPLLPWMEGGCERDADAGFGSPVGRTCACSSCQQQMPLLLSSFRNSCSGATDDRSSAPCSNRRATLSGGLLGAAGLLKSTPHRHSPCLGDGPPDDAPTLSSPTPPLPRRSRLAAMRGSLGSVSASASLGRSRWSHASPEAGAEDVSVQRSEAGFTRLRNGGAFHEDRSIDGSRAQGCRHSAPVLTSPRMLLHDTQAVLPGEVSQ